MNTQPTVAQLQAEIARLNALVSAKPSGTGIKVSTKGAVSVYGLGRFPITLYGKQWTNLAAKMPEILEFVAKNQSLLATK